MICGDIECVECGGTIKCEDDERQCPSCMSLFHSSCWNQTCVYSKEWGEFICAECGEKEDEDAATL